MVVVTSSGGGAWYCFGGAVGGAESQNEF